MAKKKKEKPQEEEREQTLKKKGVGTGKVLILLGLLLLAIAAALMHTSDNAVIVTLEGKIYGKIKDVKGLGPIAKPILHREPWELRYTEKQALQLKANLFKANDRLDVLMNRDLPQLREENRKLQGKLGEAEARLAQLTARLAAAESSLSRSERTGGPAEKAKGPKKLGASINYRTLAGRLDNLEADRIVSILAEYSVEDRAEALKKMKPAKVDEIWGLLEAGESANLLSLMSKEAPSAAKN